MHDCTVMTLRFLKDFRIDSAERIESIQSEFPASSICLQNQCQQQCMPIGNKTGANRAYVL